ncbi:PREDICTED: telomere-associated protein RIF1-like isoform X2 [Papilio polytes]|uniref:telomere-associated protein RIF1-like isoform X2 n=1 Tax=Papilio polytes TaxID=76194 RepID=UPI0006762A0D|nr:PREDICTED: telomere-associated protein RIF1-like isoform X2 [Papilio polytes]
MPEDIAVSPDLERLLEHLDDFTIDEANYQVIQDALEKNNNINVTILERLLTVCIRDLKEDIMKNPFQALNVLGTLLNKVKTGSIHEVPDLVPSANAILHIIKTTALFNKMDELKVLCFEIILSYPDNVLITLAVDHYIEIIEMLNLYCHQRIPLLIRLQALNIINKLLKILPPDKKATFVKEGIEIWFSKVVPTVMASVKTAAVKNAMAVETLEMLAEELIRFDYSNNPTWLVVLECIYTPHKYPKIMQNLLEAGNEVWYRLWIIFTKLLKSQITKNMSSFGSPINSMLPVVETAFKMNVKNRCRAFQCWNALIDNFAVEANEPYVNKRLRLLIIPLASNNAKVEETALAKLNTWLHLIRSFEGKIGSLSHIVLLPFMFFCFGKPSVGDKPVSAPGLLTINTKRQVLEAFSYIIGHTDCDCVVYMPKLNNKILTHDVLVDHWRLLTNSLTITIRICVDDDSDSVTQHFKCIWKSIIADISKIPNCTTKYNLFYELLQMLQVLLQCHSCDRLSELVFHIVTNSVLDINDMVQPVFEHGNKENNALQNIISMLLSPSLDCVFTRFNRKEIISKLKPLAKFIAQEYLKQVTVQCLKLDVYKNNSLLLWTAIAEAICEINCATSVDILHQMLLLPLNCEDSAFASVDVSVDAWFALYNFATTLVEENCIDNDIYDIISNPAITGTLNKSFVFKVSLTVLNQRIQKNSENDNLIHKCVDTLLYTMEDIIYCSVKNNLILLQKTIISMLNKLAKENDEYLAKTTVSVVNNVLKIVTKNIKQIEKDVDLANFLVKLFEPLEILFAQEAYCNLKLLISDELEKFSKCFTGTDKSVHNIINNIINQKNGTVTSNISGERSVSPGILDNFTEPQVKVPKKGKKKDSNIIDTVVENGEEYVVVNSNWKFNPKKLTDNQKEKLKRTREDIPALYQDLSQSQDEFKTAYKTNSVDSTSCSKSNTVEDNVESSILKNMPCSDVVPTIIDNIFIASPKKHIQEMTISDSVSANSNIEQKQNSNAKTPRMAIKDRVFRNVKNLIEKSGLQMDDLNSTVNENLLSTPKRKKTVDDNLVNSAPPKMNAVRPARMKRKPKKLEDHKLSPFKKRSCSVNQNNSQSIIPEQQVTQNQSLENVEKPLDDVPKLIDPPADNVTQNVDNVDKNSEQNLSNEEAKVTAIVSTVIEDETQKISETTDLEDDAIKSDSNSTIDSTTTDTDICDENIDKNNVATPHTLSKDNTSKSTKKPGRGPSRLEKILAIDMVEGHPFLNNNSSRCTRKSIETNATIITRKSIEKLSKPKSSKVSTKNDTKPKEKMKSPPRSVDKNSDSIDDLSTTQSQDIIESSQDSTISTISVKPAKHINKIPYVSLENIKDLTKLTKPSKHSDEQSMFLDTQNDVQNDTVAAETNEDIELSRNKTVLQDKTNDVTAEMDTEQVECVSSSDEVTEIKNDYPTLTISSQDTCSNNDSQETAYADTQPQDPNLLLDVNLPLQSTVTDENCDNQNETNAQHETNKHDHNYCSPLKDDVQRKQDFMKSTLEISPIKTLSPVREEQKSLTPETSRDFVIIKLSSPVQSNGEPYNNSNSPEIFTNDKISPDKRDQSPPRNGPILNNSSPSSCLSLKKNLPQVRSGRAAQMLGLCVPEGMNNFDSLKPEEKKSPSTNTSARRNLRIMYSTSENREPVEIEDNSTFLKLRRPVPIPDSSPSGPILKRKINIVDDATISPASKRKRNSMAKRSERLARVPANPKSPKRLDTVFNNLLKLENALTKTVESFTESDRISSEDSEMNSLEETAVEVNKNLSDTEPIYKLLINCNDTIHIIIDELSSTDTKSSLLKEFEGKVTTVSDLAKLTELEINKFSIKTPKVQVARKVLKEYADKTKSNELPRTEDTNENQSMKLDDELNNKIDMEVQTELNLSLASTQTEVAALSTQTQTLQSGDMTTMCLIAYLFKKPDFLSHLCENLDEPSKQEIANDLPMDCITETLIRKLDISNSDDTLTTILDQHRNVSANGTLSVLQEYLSSRFSTKDLIKLCSDILKNISDRTNEGK